MTKRQIFEKFLSLFEQFKENVLKEDIINKISGYQTCDLIPVGSRYYINFRQSWKCNDYTGLYNFSISIHHNKSVSTFWKIEYNTDFKNPKDDLIEYMAHGSKIPMKELMGVFKFLLFEQSEG